MTARCSWKEKGTERDPMQFHNALRKLLRVGMFSKDAWGLIEIINGDARLKVPVKHEEGT